MTGSVSTSRTELVQSLMRHTGCSPDTADSIIDLLRQVTRQGAVVLSEPQFVAIEAVLGLIYHSPPDSFEALRGDIHSALLAEGWEFAYFPSRTHKPAVITMMAS